jgi:uncharacterized RDD family membrane protein YckC
MAELRLVRGPQVLDPSSFVTGHHLAGLPLASFRRRAAAWVVDFNLSSLAFVVILLPALSMIEKAGVHLPTLKFTLNLFGNWYSVAWHASYFALMTWLGRGQTPGKRLLGIRVRSLGHDPVTLWQCIERALGYGASLLEGGFGFAQYFLNAQRQTVHDRIAETVVVDARARSQSADELHCGPASLPPADAAPHAPHE